MKKEYLGTHHLQTMMLKLIAMIEHSDFEFDRIVGIAKGGLHVSAPLVSHFQKPHEEITISYYHSGVDYTYVDQPLLDLGDFDPTESKFLLVDDLVDSGATLNRFKKEFNLEQGEDFRMAVLHWNPEGEFGQKPDFYVEEKYYRWIVYPWNVDEEMKKELENV